MKSSSAPVIWHQQDGPGGGRFPSWPARSRCAPSSTQSAAIEADHLARLRPSTPFREVAISCSANLQTWFFNLRIAELALPVARRSE